MPSDGPAIGFRPVTAADLPLLKRWLEQPHWREWWGEVETELGYVRDMIEGRDTTRPYIFVGDGEPCGYIQVWYVGAHQTPEWTAKEPWLAELPADAVGVDLSIGDGANLSRGIGSRALGAFVEMLVAEGHRTIVIDPHPANARAVAAYRKAGFAPIPALEGRYQRVLLMQYGLGAGTPAGEAVDHAV